MSDFGIVPDEIKELLKQPVRRKLSKSEREKVKDKCNGRCAYCGIVLGEKFHVDHAQSFYRGGTCDLDNLLPACFSCNNYKLTYSIEEFRILISRQHEIALRNSVNYRTLVRFGRVEVDEKPVKFYFETLEVAK